MSRRIKAQGPPTARSKSYLRDYAEHGYGYTSMVRFNTEHGYGKVCHKRWSVDISGFRDKFEELKFQHSKRKDILGPAPKILPPSHTEELEIWQQNFLESWRRTHKKLEAAALAKVSWAEVKHSLEVSEPFKRAYDVTYNELLVGIQDELMVKAYEGGIGAIDKLMKIDKDESLVDGIMEANWWEDTEGVAESLQ